MLSLFLVSVKLRVFEISLNTLVTLKVIFMLYKIRKS